MTIPASIINSKEALSEAAEILALALQCDAPHVRSAVDDVEPKRFLTTLKEISRRCSQ